MSGSWPMSPDVRAGWIPAGVDVVVPTAGRVYDRALYGCFNHRVDRELWDAIEHAYPAARAAVLANREFLQRSVHLLIEAGIRQFLDLGAGYPYLGGVPAMVHDLGVTARVLGVDIDPIAVDHTNHLLKQAGTRQAWAIRGDLNHPDRFLPWAAQLLDFREPVAVLATATLHYLTDASQAAALLDRIAGELVDGSYLALTHATPETSPQLRARQHAAVQLFDRTPTLMVLRTVPQILALLGDGWESLPPGLSVADRWHPDPDDQDLDGPGCPASLLAAVARRRQHRPRGIGQAAAATALTARRQP
jgi:hypothetical protein